MKRILLLLLILHSSLFTFHSFAQNPCHFVGYHCDTVAYNFTPIAGDTLFAMADNTYSPVIPIGFSFCFYDIDYTSLVISNNCFVSFNTALADSSCPWYISVPIPSSSNPLNAIFGPWQDVYNVLQGTIHYQTIGTAPYRKFIVSYDSIPMLMCSSEYFTGQIVLYETSNIIEIHINSKLICNAWNSGLAIEGIQNANASMALAAPGRNCPNQWTAYHDGRRFSPLNGPFPAPSICLVTVDTATNQNLVIWNQPTGITIDSFLIFREYINTGNFPLVATQAQPLFSTYEDVSSLPMQSANRYKLAFKDSCGIISYLSNNHRTIHLTLSHGTASSWNLNWNAYEGFTFANYYIYRGSSPSTMSLLTSVSSSLLTYHDTNPPAGNLYYMITITGPGGCAPSARINIINYNVSMSNIANTNTIGMPAIIDDKMISILPNPSSGTLSINNQYFTQTIDITVLDIMGNTVHSLPQKTMLQGTNEIDLSTLNNGIYFIKIQNSNSSIMKRICILK